MHQIFVVSVEEVGEIVNIRRWSAYPLSLCFGVPQATFGAFRDHVSLQFRKNSCDLKKGCGHGIERTVSAVNSDRILDNQLYLLIFHGFNDIAKLLGASCQSRQLSNGECVTAADHVQQLLQLDLVLLHA